MISFFLGTHLATSKIFYRTLVAGLILFLSSCASSSESKERYPVLSVEGESAILHDLISEFVANFPPEQNTVQIVSENNSVNSSTNEADVLAVLLRKNRYEICKSNKADVILCSSKLSSFVKKIDPDLHIYHAGLNINDVLQVSRFYRLSPEGDVVPSTTFYVRASEVFVKLKIPELVIEPIPKLVMEPIPKLVMEAMPELVMEAMPETEGAPVKPPSSPDSLAWQVQVMASVDKEAMLAVQKTLENRGVNGVLVFEAPFYKLRVGPYFTKRATWKAQKTLIKRYAGAFVVKVAQPNE